MLQISFTPSMSITDVITSVGVVIAMFTLINAVRRYRHDHRQQLAAQTREDLQAIIGDCALFLRPLSQSHPYPIFHTVTAITKEFCSRMGASPRPENVQ